MPKPDDCVFCFWVILGSEIICNCAYMELSQIPCRMNSDLDLISLTDPCSWFPPLGFQTAERQHNRFRSKTCCPRRKVCLLGMPALWQCGGAQDWNALEIWPCFRANSGLLAAETAQLCLELSSWLIPGLFFLVIIIRASLLVLASPRPQLPST